MAAGGLIKQNIVILKPGRHTKSNTVTFNAQILNSAHFEHVTRKAPPECPITAQTYAEHGFPYFAMYEEPTTIAGDFSRVKSVAQIDGSPENTPPGQVVVDVHTLEPVGTWTCEVCDTLDDMTGHLSCRHCGTERPIAQFVNSQGPKTEFRFAWEIQEALKVKRSVI